MNKVPGLRLLTLLKNRPWQRYFPVNLAKFLRTSVYRTPPVAASDTTRLLFFIPTEREVLGNNTVPNFKLESITQLT